MNMRNRLVQVVCAGLVTASAASAQPVRTEVRVDSSLYDGYVGRYHLSPTAALIITRDGDHLFAQVGNLPPAEIFPASTKRYFYKEIDAQITFETDGRGQATAVIRRVDGKDSRGKRLGDLPKPFD